MHERSVSRGELVFDLVSAGICHVLSSEAAEAPNAVGITKFAIVFYLSYSIWTDVRTWMNQSGCDDLLQRLIMLVYMVIMAGFAANATAVNIVYAETDGCKDATPIREDKRGLDRQWLNPRHSPGSLLTMAIRSPTKEDGLGSCADVRAHIVGGYYFDEGYRAALHAAACFYVWAKAIRLALLVVYGWQLKAFRRALWLQAGCLAGLAILFLSLLAADSSSAVIVLIFVGMAADVGLRYVVSVATQWVHGWFKRKSKSGHTQHSGLGHVPAINVEHLAERMMLFSLLTIGEVILSSMFTASANPHDSEVGFSRLWATSALGICCALFLAWLLFDAHGSRSYVHALRRGPVFSFAYTSIYFPMCGALVLLGSALERLVEEARVRSSAVPSRRPNLRDDFASRSPSGLDWLLSASVAVVLLCVAALGCLHKSLDVPRTALIPTRVRIVVRLLAAALAATVPLMTGTHTSRSQTSSDWEAPPASGFPRLHDFEKEVKGPFPLYLVGAHAAILFLLVMFEVVSKLGSVAKSYDRSQAAIRHHEHMQARTFGRRMPGITAALPGLGATVRQSCSDERPPWSNVEGLSPSSPFTQTPLYFSGSPTSGTGRRASFASTRNAWSLRPTLSLSRDFLTTKSEMSEARSPLTPCSSRLQRLVGSLAPGSSTNLSKPENVPGHEYSDLGATEQGFTEGNEHIGQIRPRPLRKELRWALLAN